MRGDAKGSRRSGNALPAVNGGGCGLPPLLTTLSPLSRTGAPAVPCVESGRLRGPRAPPPDELSSCSNHPEPGEALLRIAQSASPDAVATLSIASVEPISAPRERGRTTATEAGQVAAPRR